MTAVLTSPSRASRSPRRRPGSNSVTDGRDFDAWWDPAVGKVGDQDGRIVRAIAGSPCKPRLLSGHRIDDALQSDSCRCVCRSRACHSSNRAGPNRFACKAHGCRLLGRRRRRAPNAPPRCVRLRRRSQLRGWSMVSSVSVAGWAPPEEEGSATRLARKRPEAAGPSRRWATHRRYRTSTVQS